MRKPVKGQDPKPGNGKSNRSPKDRPNFKSEYRHYRTGKIMKASDYGYKGWPF